MTAEDQVTVRWLVTWNGYSETACIAVVTASSEEEARAAALRLSQRDDPTARWMGDAIGRGSAYRIDHDFLALQDAEH